VSDERLAMAKVGLRALIDEATGFQAQRDPDDLRRYAESLGVSDLALMIDERIRLSRNLTERGAAE
jgi:hypothetical protein